MNKKNFSQKKFATRFDGYYVSEDGRVWSEWHKRGSLSYKGEFKEINPFPRGGSDSKDRYMSVNVSVRDENGKFLKQIQYYVHRLVAETLVENPNNYLEIDHIDRDKKNNCVDNLRWVSRKKNLQQFNTKSYTIIDTVNGKTWKGTNIVEWVQENYDMINNRMKKKNRPPETVGKDLCSARSKKYKIWKFIVEF